MAYVSRVFRRVEIVLWIVGICLVGGALGATFSRWHYQQEQERALFAGTAAPAPVPETQVAGPIQLPTPAPEEVEPVVVAKEKPKKVTAAPPSAFGRIEIPRIGVKAIVKVGEDEKTLARAVGLVPGGARPGQPGNIILAGHRDTFFRSLGRIRINDQIRVQVPPHTYEYRVDSAQIVSPENVSVLESRGVEQLTLVTCYPFNLIGPAPDRFIVSATRVN